MKTFRCVIMDPFVQSQRAVNIHAAQNDKLISGDFAIADSVCFVVQVGNYNR